VAAIFEMEETDDQQFLVLEYVPGESLAERLKRGPVALKEALKICCDLARGLEAAHAKAMIHRDLKPANVQLTPEGKVKVLDFGLAKAFGHAIAPDERSHHRTMTVHTAEHSITGTIPYMSPEQASGMQVDKRTDLWAFGCILYELLTATRAFAGDNPPATLAAIQGRDPDWEMLPAGTPATVRKLLRRCLAKDPDRRMRDIGDARIELEEAMSTGPESAEAAGGPAHRAPGRRLSPLVLVAAGVLIGVAAVALWSGLRTREGAQEIAPAGSPAAVAEGRYLLVGHLIDFTGVSGWTGLGYSQGIIDSVNWINENGGINGKLIDMDTAQTSYLLPPAVAAYQKWQTQDVLAVQGWGTHITEFLSTKATEDEVPFFSASCAASLSDPTGKATGKPAPYNYFYGPTYSDGCRGLVEWAAKDWKERGSDRAPRYVHAGDNHPFPNSPKAACEAYAAELGFDVLPAIVVPMEPVDYSPQCRRLAESGADYAFLANLSQSVTRLLTTCHEMQVKPQFMVSVWGYDEVVMKTAGAAADGVVNVMTAAKWGDEVSGMYLVREISKMSDPVGDKYRTIHYLKGICSMFYLKEAMEWADLNGGITGRNIKQGMYARTDWVPQGLEGVCGPATWTADDHRGMTRVRIYRGSVSGPTDDPLPALIERGAVALEEIDTVEIPRREAWLGK
jgi:branched-chain amino acid transport system substrate-binding protein